jgi:exonuclease III
MSLFCWNCRGLRNPCTVRDLHHMVQEKKPNFVFLIETLCKRKTMEKIRCKLGFEGLLLLILLVGVGV